MAPETNALPGHETVQEIVEELLAMTRLDAEAKAKYRRRVGIALLMEAVEAVVLVESRSHESGEGKS